MKTRYFIDPPSVDFMGNQLFEESSPLNRDGSLLPFIRLKKNLSEIDIQVDTADILLESQLRDSKNYYWSLGSLDNYQKVANNNLAELESFILLEPPLISRKMYNQLPQLSRFFKKVFLHNTNGDQYSLAGVQQEKLHKVFWPQPYKDVVEKYWNKTERINKAVIISGNHRARERANELYSNRIYILSNLAKKNFCDLYGRNWNKWYSKESLWYPYWVNIFSIFRNYKGECQDKLEVLSDYRFSMCFENMEMEGYITEKIFDCFYAGTVPVYKGSPSVGEDIPVDCFVHFNDFKSIDNLYEYLFHMPLEEYEQYRKNAREFLQTKGKQRYFASLQSIFQHSS